MIRLGYVGINLDLRNQGVLCSRTIRLDTVKKVGIDKLKELFAENVSDLKTIIKWNIENKVGFFRISSDIAPHITNHLLLEEKDRDDPQKLVYNLEELADELRDIGNLARSVGMRLTMHPGQYVNLGSPDRDIIIRSIREIYYHAKLLDIMDLGPESIYIIHGGGTYGDKEATMNRWISTFDSIPISIKSRLVLENDEFNYSLTDVLEISKRVKKFREIGSGEYNIPIVLDIFHYVCYGKYHKKPQKQIEDWIEIAWNTWGVLRPKMHISRQKPKASLGTHSDYIQTIPPVLINTVRRTGRSIDLMVEAKKKERALRKLKNKYPDICY